MKKTQLLLHRFPIAAALTVLMALLIQLAAPSAFAKNYWWSNAAATMNVWGQSANWATNAAGDTSSSSPGPSDTTIFNIDSLTSAQTIGLNGNRSVAGLQFTNGTTWTIQANTVNSTTYGLNIGAGGITIGSGVGSVVFSSGQGNLSNALTADQTWDVNSSFTVNAGISGTYNLTKSGSAWLYLQAQNTYTGNTVINGGTVSIQNQIYFNSATVNSTITVSNNALLIVKTFGQNANSSQSLGNLNSNPASLILDGGTVRITADNASRGRGLTVGPNGATIQVYSGSVITNTGTFVTPYPGSILTLDGDATSSGRINSVLTNSISLVKAGTCTWTLAGANTYTGDTTVSDGTLAIQLASIATNSTVSVAAGAVLQLSFTETNTVAGFYTNGVALPDGIYNAANVSPFIAGSGSLQVGIIAPSGPTLTSVTPNPVIGSSYLVPLMLTGSGFTGATAVLLTNLTSSTGGSYTYTVNSDTSIAVTSFAPGTAASSWNATVVGDTPSAQVGFTVRAPSAVNINTSSLNSASAGGLVLSGTNGTAGYSYVVVCTTNLVPPATWTPMVTNQFDGSGNFSYTNVISPNTPKLFLRIQQ